MRCLILITFPYIIFDKKFSPNADESGKARDFRSCFPFVLAAFEQVFRNFWTVQQKRCTVPKFCVPNHDTFWTPQHFCERTSNSAVLSQEN